MSEHTDNPELEDEMTRVIETDTAERDEDEHWVESESEEETEWDELADGELPPRPRSRLLRPLPIALVAVMLATVGFLAGVQVQKGSDGGDAASGGMPSFAAGGLPGGGEAGGSAASSDAGSIVPLAGAAGTEAATSGTVTSVDGATIYVRESDGTVVAVKAEDGSTLTREANVAAKQIHPGDTVVVEGSKRGSSVTASSIAATESGVESSAGGFPAAAAASGDGEEDAVESLFE